jgi:site-specific DNA recombinase
MIAAIYARKSTEQGGVADEAKSVTRQVENATAYAAGKGWTVDSAHVYIDDAVSGAEFVNRPGLAHLLAALSPRPKFAALILAEPSRLGREQIETAYTLKRITDAGVAVWYYLDDRRAAMDSALAKVMASLSGFASESEREQARARTYDALARKAKAGHVAGGVVYGYVNVRVDGHVERRILEPEAAAVRRIFELYAIGTGLRAIAKTLTAEGAPPPTPRQRDRIPGWGPAALREILRRDLYRGEVVWNRRKKTDRGGRTKVRVIRPETDLVRVADDRVRIVDDDLWRQCQARRAELAATKPAGTWTRSERVTRPALLSGLGRCGVCGAGLVRATRAHGSARQRRRVRCTPAAGPLGGSPARTASRSRRRPLTRRSSRPWSRRLPARLSTGPSTWPSRSSERNGRAGRPGGRPSSASSSRSRRGRSAWPSPSLTGRR